MTINQLYLKLMRQIDQLLPNERVTRKRVLAWLIFALFYGRSAHASKISNKIPGQAKKPSKAARFHRWLKNRAVRPRLWYESVARNLIRQAVMSGQPIRLIVDGTRIGSNHQLLMVALAYRRRALPIAWTWVRKRRGHSSATKQVALLSYVQGLIPSNGHVILLGDSEFGAISVLETLEKWSWNYVLRQKGRYLMQYDATSSWQRLDSMLSKVGQKVWMPSVALTQKHAFSTSIVAYWKRGEKEPWFLATNFDSASEALRFYSRRMWIEEMFGDFKRNGFDLESIRLRHFARLSRFTMVVALLYVWLVAFGSKTIKQGKRHFVDRKKKPSTEYFSHRI